MAGVGAFSFVGPASRDAALLQTLGSGAYTVQVTATPPATPGTALVDISVIRRNCVF
jgi:hypothetical protein